MHTDPPPPLGPDDDPTQALDDFVRRMRTPTAPVAAPDLSDLLRQITPDAAAGVSARPRGGRLRSGETWDADDVVDVAPVTRAPAPVAEPAGLPALNLPVVDLRDAEPVQLDLRLRPDPDTDTARSNADDRGMADACNSASRFAADQIAADADGEQRDWQPNLQALQLRRTANPRIVPRWQPGVWTGAMRQVFDGATEFVNTTTGPVVETYAAHRLGLAWSPQNLDAPLLGRWPQQAQLSAVPGDQAAEQLLAQLPEGATLWLNPLEDAVDWALAAELVLHHEPALRPFQVDGLRGFIATEREASFARINAGYAQTAPGGPVSQTKPDAPPR